MWPRRGFRSSWHVEGAGEGCIRSSAGAGGRIPVAVLRALHSHSIEQRALVAPLAVWWHPRVHRGAPLVGDPT
eukprot:4997232-Prymnesium_polylepis.1